MSGARAVPAILLALVVACGGAAFQSIDDAPDAAGDAVARDASTGDDVADAGTTDRDVADAVSVVDARRIDAPAASLCCTVASDAGPRAVPCGPGDWACVVDAGPPPRFDTCFANPKACPSASCVLNDNTHGLVPGDVTLCP